MKPKRWKIEPHTGHSEVQGSIINKVLVNRGVVTPEDQKAFIACSVASMHDPMLLPDMATIIQRIQLAVADQSLIAIYGDYDVDGITSTSILMRALTYLGAQVTYYIPNRIEEGYGLNSEAISNLASQGVKVIITVDCGITSVDQALVAKDHGVDLMITDHHECQENLPQAYVICNPKLPSATYPFDMLAGAGIAFKVAQALLGPDFEACANELWQLAAVGTIADLAPLHDENRVIAQMGLQAMTLSPILGIKALLDVSGVKKEVTAGHVGFMIGPRLNAIGRLDDASAGVKLLITDSPEEARQIALDLNQLNQERQDTEKRITQEAIEKISQNPIHLQSGIIIVWGKDWHEGVVGIVASRLTERFYRPSIVLVEKEEGFKGSARSIEGYSIFDALMTLKKWLTKFGGHEQAAGLSLTKEALPGLLEGLKVYNQSHLTPDLLIENLRVDALLHSKEINHDLLNQLGALEPHGLGNPKPSFRYDCLKVEQARRIGKDESHVKVVVDESYRLLEALKFQYGNKWLPQRNQRVDMAFNLDLNTFNGVESIQFMLKDMRHYHPDATYFAKHWYVIYAIYLFDVLGHHKIKHLESQNYTFRLTEDVISFTKTQTPLVVSSYEGLLELAYIYHDLGLDLEEALKDPGCPVSVLAMGQTLGQVALDLPLFTNQLTSQNAYIRRLDHHVLKQRLGELYFDRSHFAGLYQKIRSEGKLKLHTHLMTSQSVLKDLLAIKFFEESGFIHISAGVVSLSTGNHHKVEYEATTIAKQVNLLIEQVIKVVGTVDAHIEI